jgi:hypothetical protein
MKLCFLFRMLFVGLLVLGMTAGFSLSPKATYHQTPRRSPLYRDSSALSMTASASVSENLLPGIGAINKANDDLFEKLEALRENPYFRFYSVDILASCEYMPQELFECYTETCEIYPADEEDVRKDGWLHFDLLCLCRCCAVLLLLYMADRLISFLIFVLL